MPKRFTDSHKWHDTWFSDLPIKYKLFWLYLLDNVNHAGIWKVNFKLANFLIGEEIKLTEIDNFFKNRIVKVSKKYWFVPKFIKFQYPKGLSANVSAQRGVINELNKYKIDLDTLTVSKQLRNSYETVQDKDKDIDIYIKEIKNSHQWLESIYMLYKIKKGSISKLLELFLLNLRVTNKTHSNFNEFKSHFNNWLQVQDNKQKLNDFKIKRNRQGML